VLDTFAMRSVRIALSGGLALVAVAVGLTLTRSPTIAVARNGIPAETILVGTRNGARACQAGETLPAGTSAIRLALVAEIGPRVTVTVTSSGGAAITHGTRSSKWTGASVTVPVERVSRTSAGAQVCFVLGRPLETVAIVGRRTPAAVALTSGAQKLPGRMAIEYVRQSSTSWLSLAPSIARRMGLGHAWGGTWIAFVLVAAMTCSLALLCRLAVRELR
jgi:hypothetical protein